MTNILYVIYDRCIWNDDNQSKDVILAKLSIAQYLDHCLVCETQDGKKVTASYAVTSCVSLTRQWSRYYAIENFTNITSFDWLSSFHIHLSWITYMGVPIEQLHSVYYCIYTIVWCKVRSSGASLSPSVLSHVKWYRSASLTKLLLFCPVANDELVSYSADVCNTLVTRS